MKLMTVVLMSFLIANQAFSDEQRLLSQILTNISQQHQNKFHFVQEKKLSILDKPLITEGELQLDQNTVIWNIQKPYTIRYILTPDSIREIDEQGERILHTGQNPVAAAMTQSMSAVFSGQWQDSTALTNMAATGTLTDWHLMITPQSTELQKLIKTMYLTGNAGVISSITIAEINGDSTIIRLQPTAGH